MELFLVKRGDYEDRRWWGGHGEKERERGGVEEKSRRKQNETQRLCGRFKPEVVKVNPALWWYTPPSSRCIPPLKHAYPILDTHIIGHTTTQTCTPLPIVFIQNLSLNHLPYLDALFLECILRERHITSLQSASSESCIDYESFLSRLESFISGLHFRNSFFKDKNRTCIQ